MLKVLVVDDNQNNRLTLELLLEEVEGVEVSEAEDGAVAVRMCQEGMYELIFMDIMMPNMDGFEATQAIKALHPSAMIIALSALDDDASKQKMLCLGAEDYLTKPLSSDLFQTRIHHYMRIIALRHKASSGSTVDIKESEDAINPFGAPIFHRQITFFIPHEAALAEFWDYWLIGEKAIADISDCVRLVYGFGLWLLKHNEPFSIVAEEGIDRFYITLLNVHAIKPSVIKNILLRHFPSARYILSETQLCFALEKLQTTKPSEGVVISDDAKKVLSKTHDTVLSAVDYVESTAISFMPKIENLEEINDEIDRAIVDFEQTPSVASMAEVCRRFQAYVMVLEELIEFAHLGFAIKTLIDFLSGIEEGRFEEAKVRKLASMLINLLHDLNAWRENVFITQVARDIHYLDASLLSSCIQIEAIFEEKSAEVQDDEIEFF